MPSCRSRRTRTGQAGRRTTLRKGRGPHRLVRHLPARLPHRAARSTTRDARRTESLMPTRLWMYTNFDCNLACDYCCVVSGPRADPRRLPVERIRSLVDQAVHPGMDGVFLTGGEPDPRPTCPTLIEYVTDRLPLTLLTNAMLLRGPRWDRLRPLIDRDRRPVAFQVSLDSATPERHDAHRGRGAHAGALTGIRHPRSTPEPASGWPRPFPRRPWRRSRRSTVSPTALGSRRRRTGSSGRSPFAAQRPRASQSGRRTSRRSSPATPRAGSGTHCRTIPTCAWTCPPTRPWSRPSTPCVARLREMLSTRSAGSIASSAADGRTRPQETRMPTSAEFQSPSDVGRSPPARGSGGPWRPCGSTSAIVFLHNGIAKVLPAVPNLWPDTPLGFVINAVGPRSARSILEFEVVTQGHPDRAVPAPRRAGRSCRTSGRSCSRSAPREMVVGVLLILGLVTPIAALVAALMVLHLQFATLWNDKWLYEYSRRMGAAPVPGRVPGRALAWAGRPARRDPRPVARVIPRHVMPALAPARTLVTGGAGFIGGELIASLLADGSTVTVLDDLSTAEPDWHGSVPRLARSALRARGTLRTDRRSRAAMAGQDRVVHLASGTDIAGGFDHPSETSATASWRPSCLRGHARGRASARLWYASSGVVYGRPCRVSPPPKATDRSSPSPTTPRPSSPVRRSSSGFAHLYGWRAFAFRFGNTVGARSQPRRRARPRGQAPARSDPTRDPG